MSHGCSPGEERWSGQPAEQCTERTGSSLPFPSHPPWWTTIYILWRRTWDISPKSVQCGESNMGRGRNLHPNAAAGTEASLSLFFSGDKLNLEGEKKFCPWNIPPAGNFFRESPELWKVQVFFFFKKKKKATWFGPRCSPCLQCYCDYHLSSLYQWLGRGWGAGSSWACCKYSICWCWHPPGAVVADCCQEPNSWEQ